MNMTMNDNNYTNNDDAHASMPSIQGRNPDQHGGLPGHAATMHVITGLCREYQLFCEDISEAEAEKQLDKRSQILTRTELPAFDPSNEKEFED